MIEHSMPCEDSVNTYAHTSVKLQQQYVYHHTCIFYFRLPYYNHEGLALRIECRGQLQPLPGTLKMSIFTDCVELILQQQQEEEGDAIHR